MQVTIDEFADRQIARGRSWGRSLIVADCIRMEKVARP
jgi:hypothetical protein